MSETIRQLTSAVASGDPEALARLYRRWFDFAFSEARRCTGRDEQFCLDAVQEAMLRAIRGLRRLESEAALAAWLRAAVRSASIDLLRRELRGQRRAKRRAALQSEADDPNSRQQELSRARLAWLQAQLAALPADQSSLLHLRFRLGWTLNRIGEAMGLKSGAVDGRLTRTLAELRAAAPEDIHE